MNDETYNGPFIDHHLLYWELEKQGYPNILYLTYEEMINDLPSVIERTQKFLGKSYSKDQLEQLRDHLSFDKMKSEISENSIYFNFQYPFFLFFRERRSKSFGKGQRWIGR